MSEPIKLQYRLDGSSTWHNFYYNAGVYDFYSLTEPGKIVAVRVAPKRSAEDIVEKLREDVRTGAYTYISMLRVLDGDF